MAKKDSKGTKFLIIRFSAFGDVVQTLSVPSAIAQAYPQAEVHWITRSDVAPLLEGHPHIQKIWSYNKKTGLKGLIDLCCALREQKYTHIYDAHNNSRSRIISLFLRPLGILGFGPKFIRRSIRRWKRFLLFKFRINKFEQPFSGQRDLLEPLQPWGISKLPPPAPQMYLNSDDTQRAQKLIPEDFKNFVALAPSAAHLLKRWPVDHWKKLILLNSQTHFVLLGGPEDSFIEEIHQVAPERTLNLAGKASLAVSSSIVATAQILIANDTGLLHVAEQLGKPAIALMGPAPFGFPSRKSTDILELNLPCRPCSKHGQGPCVNKNFFHECLVAITPETVTLHLQKLQQR